MYIFDSINIFNSLSTPRKKSTFKRIFPESITKEKKMAFYQAIPGLAVFLVLRLFYRFTHGG